jgi:predicted ATPase
MLTKWKLFNFKSILKETELEFKPLTIFAGANSSGKSTVLQSILLVSQTTASKIPSRSVVLNGHLVKLGQFDDLRHHQSESQQISIGWECKPLDDSSPQSVGRPPSLRQKSFTDPIAQLKSVSGSFSFDAVGNGLDRELSQLQPGFFGMNLHSIIRAEDGSDVQCRLSISKKSDDELAKAGELNLQGLNDSAKEEVLKATRYEVSLDKSGEQILREGELSFDIRGCVIRHFLPKGFVTSFEIEKNLAESVVRALRGGSIPRRFQDSPIPEEVVKLVKSHFKNDPHPGLVLSPPTGNPGETTINEISIRDCWQKMRSKGMNSDKRDIIRKIIDGLELEIHSIICRSELPNIGWRRIALPEPARAAVEYTEEWFSDNLKYLGPLRDEPKPQYPLVANADPFDVGLKGEHTAAVLHLHRDKPVNYLPSENFRNAKVLVQPARRSLKFAVLDWLRYLGVAEDVDTQDKGKFGHEMKVRLSTGDQPHDLTHVGVGVSQVLPIVVSCLLANRDTTLIFEQPELHLHPRVQTLLADFFISMAQLGKQCVLETHSEYLINRLRFRAAAADKDAISSISKLFFVEKRDGASAFREVHINQYGAILDWPDGFFDQSQSEAEEILRAATIKKRAEKEVDPNDKRNS